MAVDTAMPQDIANGVARPDDAIETSVGWVQRASSTVKGWFSRGWSWLKRAFTWVKDKVVAGARWVRRQVVSGSRWLWGKTKVAWSWSKRKARVGWNWSKDKAGVAWRWTKRAASASWGFTRDTAVGAWHYTSPFRNWVATPFRMAATAIGAAGVPVLLGWTVAGLALVGIVAWVAIAGRDEVTVKDPNTIAPEDYRELNDPQKVALNARASAVRDQGELHTDAGKKPEISEYSGRLFLLQQRLAGSTETAEQIIKIQRQKLEVSMGRAEADANYIWSACARGIRDEDKVARKLIDDHAEASV